MVVDARVWYWTKVGMAQGAYFAGRMTPYIEQSEVERLLEEAHARGRREGLAEAEQRIEGRR